MSTTQILEGYSAEHPIADDDWEDEVRWALNDREAGRREMRGHHNQEGYLAHEAGSPQCLALGHVEPEGGWDEDPDDGHLRGFDGDSLCRETKYDTCCTECEGECQASVEDDITRDDFWALPGVRAKDQETA